MNTLALRITPGEFRELVMFIRFNTHGHTSVPLHRRPLGLAVLHMYLTGLTPARLYTWQVRDRRKQYALKMPVTVALALHKEMQNAMLTGAQQLLLGTLDQAMVNYQNPYGQPQVIADLLNAY
ncbi:hypothetical protein [Fibrella aquatica]|uniref:hypothetical protein n=1 Tax=Fibrella aquatica TaxID=3242487 RepID=UPI00351FAC30